MKRVWIALGLACVACCLPLIIPFLGIAGVAGLGGWATGMNWAEIACQALIAGAIGAVAVIFLKRREARRPGSEASE